MILAGNNEDWFDPKTKMWFVPAENGNFGRVYFGFDNFYPQGGMNEKGLFFDGFATELTEVVNSKGKPYFRGNLADHAMATCTTVDEVIALFQAYNLEHFKNGMLMFGDASGKSVIIEGDDFVLKNGDFQVCTNFYQSKTNPEDIDCWRYLKATELLKANSYVSVELCKSVLEAVHVDFTRYSNIYDLKQKKIYLYHFHNFENVVEIELKTELKKGGRSYNIASLFPENEEFIKRSRHKATPVNNKPIFLFLSLCSFVFVITPFVLPFWKKRMLATLSREDKALFILFRPAQIFAAIGCYALIIFLLALSQHPELFQSGLPKDIRGLSILQTVILYIPWLVLVLTSAMSVFSFIVLKKRLWTQGLRTYYLWIAALLWINLGFLQYWNLIRV